MKRRADLMTAVNIPLRVLRARERLTWQLALKFSEAMKIREYECRKAGIPYLGTSYSTGSPDKTYDILGNKTTQYHTENMMLRILISKLEHIVYKASNGNIWGANYTGAVKDILGSRSIASCII